MSTAASISAAFQVTPNNKRGAALHACCFAAMSNLPDAAALSTAFLRALIVTQFMSNSSSLSPDAVHVLPLLLMFTPHHIVCQLASFTGQSTSICFTQQQTPLEWPQAALVLPHQTLEHSRYPQPEASCNRCAMPATTLYYTCLIVSLTGFEGACTINPRKHILHTTALSCLVQRCLC
jgi:hypothetical protein